MAYWPQVAGGLDGVGGGGRGDSLTWGPWKVQSGKYANIFNQPRLSNFEEIWSYLKNRSFTYNLHPICCIFWPVFGYCTLQRWSKISVFNIFHIKKLKKEKKQKIGCKIWQICAAPKRWLKYTTLILQSTIVHFIPFSLLKKGIFWLIAT